LIGNGYGLILLPVSGWLNLFLYRPREERGAGSIPAAPTMFPFPAYRAGEADRDNAGE